MSTSRKIMCIGLDGATWNILRPRMAAGQMPNLKRLCEGGAVGELDSIFPPETPAAWGTDGSRNVSSRQRRR